MIEFPNLRSCFTCYNSLVDGQGVTHCVLYADVIDFEGEAAKNCPTYDFTPEGTQLHVIDELEEL